MQKLKTQTQNIFLLGSKEEYSILKTWSEQDRKKRFYLNGWFHDKDIPALSSELINEYQALVGDSTVHHFILDPINIDPNILQASIDWAESHGSRIHLIQDGTSSFTS